MPNSSQLVLPIKEAPAALAKLTHSASSSGWKSRSILDAAVVGSSVVQKTSFTAIERPLREPLVFDLAVFGSLLVHMLRSRGVCWRGMRAQSTEYRAQNAYTVPMKIKGKYIYSLSAFIARFALSHSLATDSVDQKK